MALDIYKDGVSNRTFVASTASSGSYTWTVGQFQAFPPGTNYTIKIRSTTNPSLYDFSEPFSMITNLTSVTIATVPTGLAVTVDGTNYTVAGGIELVADVFPLLVYGQSASRWRWPQPLFVRLLERRWRSKP